MLDDAYFFFAFGHFQLGDTGLLNEVDEFFQFAKVHGGYIP